MSEPRPANDGEYAGRSDLVELSLILRLTDLKPRQERDTIDGDDLEYEREALDLLGHPWYVGEKLSNLDQD